jgi:putative drug exporter of the RND superfamily
MSTAVAPVPERPSAFARLGSLVVRHRVAVVGAWLVAIAIALPFAPQAGSALRAGGFTSDELEAAQARNMLVDELGLAPSQLAIVIESETEAGAGDPSFEAAVTEVMRDVPSAEHVVGILPHGLVPRQVSPDGRTVYEVVSLDLSPDESPEALEPVQAALRTAPGVRALLAGGPVFYGDIQAVSERDLQRAELISLPVAALALLLVFGSVVAAGVPLVVGGAAVLVALSAIFGLASVTPMSIFVLNLATLLGLGLGVDYSLLMTSRFREELLRLGGGRRPDGSVDREAVDAAVVATVATAGRAVFFSGLTVLLGLSGLLLFEFMILRSVGIAGAIVVGVAALAALTLLPAGLALVGPSLERLSIRRSRPPAPGSAPAAAVPGADIAAGRWERLAERVMDHPWRVFVPTLALLLLLGAPFLHVRFNAPDATILPPDVPSRTSYDILAREFGEGEFAPLILAVRTTGPATEPANIALLYDWSRRLATDPRVSRVDSIVDVDPRLSKAQYRLLYASPAGVPDRFAATALAATTRGELTTIRLTTPYGPNAAEGRALVEALRDPGSRLAPPPGLTVLVGGGPAEVTDVVDRVAADFPRTALFIFVTTYLALFLLLRSVVLPLKALIMNSLSILASFGALVWIFQDGNLSAPLAFSPLGFVETTQPVILFCVLFGLSMDYEVFLLSRMKEVYDRTGDNRLAVARGLARSGRIVTSAALIVVLVAASFAFADIVLIKALGIGMAIAVALDATVVRAFLVPSTMRLLGDWNWWLPARLERFIASRLPVIEGATLPSLATFATRATLVAVLVGAVVLLAACSPGGRLLGRDPAPRLTPPPATERPVAPADPQPISFPIDDAPHDRLTEWWYYTGHLRTDVGRRFGFEYVIFRAERGAFPVSWASHLALTDEAGRRFRYDQRSEIGPQVDRSQPGQGFDLSIVARDASGTALSSAAPWTVRGVDGQDRLQAASESAGFGLDLALGPDERPAVLHDKDGWIDFGPAGGSYYYSRPRLPAAGTLTLDGEPLGVQGSAWFDHQWGDFISVGGGGWDWFAVNLDDGSDLTFSLVRAADGSLALVHGTYVGRDGRTEHLRADDFTTESTGNWTSPTTGAVYPSGWRVRVPSQGLDLNLTPTLEDQELDARESTAVVYWEGSQHVTGTRDGRPIGGDGYVELTGYGPSGIVALP